MGFHLWLKKRIKKFNFLGRLNLSIEHVQTKEIVELEKRKIS
jgi:hypothetical protein